MHIPLAPKWNKAVDGLDMEDFSRRARDFERSRLPQAIVFPLEGQLWQAIRDCEVGSMAWFSRAAVWSHSAVATPTHVPFFPCGAARLKEGETVRILALEDPRPLTVSFLPIRYAELEACIVPEHMRKWPGYSHYQLTAPTARTFGIEKTSDYFSVCFQLVEGTAGSS